MVFHGGSNLTVLIYHWTFDLLLGEEGMRQKLNFSHICPLLPPISL